MVGVRSNVWHLRLDLVPGVPEDLDGRLGHLVVLHLEALEQRLVGLGRVEGGRVGERQHLGGGGREVSTDMLLFHRVRIGLETPCDSSKPITEVRVSRPTLSSSRP